MTNYLKRFISIFICFLIFAVPPLVNAGLIGTAGRYALNAVKSIKGGASVEATNLATGAKHMIKHGVSSEALGKEIGAGVIQFGVSAGLGLAFEAITGLALDAVDWLKDPENNAIKWKPKGGGGVYSYTSGDVLGIYSSNFDAARAACARSALPLTPSAVVFDANKKVLSFDCLLNGQSFATVQLNVASRDVPYRAISYDELAKKTLDMADSGNTTSQQTVVDFVKKQAESGALDKELDESTDITKPDDESAQCSAGYVKNAEGKCIKKDEEKKECPAGTIPIGDRCIKLPDDTDTGTCGDCCPQLIAILTEMAKMNAKFYEKSLDNDALTLYQLKELNKQIEQLSIKFDNLLLEAKQTNKTLTEINDNQKIHFDELQAKLDILKKAIDDSKYDDTELLKKIDDVKKAIDDTNKKLEKINENLEKINENLEKMQKCNETEFNKKMCELADWLQEKFDKPDDDGKVDIKDFELPGIDTNKVNFANQCPAPTPLDISISSLMINFHDELNYQPLCDFMTKLRPFVVGFGWVSGAMIVAGVGRRS